MVLHSFNSATDGANPKAALTVGQDGVTLYGTTNQGGSSLGANATSSGTIFSLSTDGTVFALLYTFNASVEGTSNTTALVQANATTFYSANFLGGANGGGTVFSVTLSGNTATVTVLYNFDQSAANGSRIVGNIVLDNGTLFGTATFGGTNNFGAIFAVKTDGSTTGSPLIYIFTNGADGNYPGSGLHLLNGRLYGATQNGGVNNAGAIFSLAEDGTGFAVTYSPSSVEGITMDLSVGTDGFLYGVAGGGSSNLGVLFQLSPDGATFTDLHDFLLDNADPEAPLIQGPDGAFYGTTKSGGADGAGTVFSISADGSAFTLVHSFVSTDGGDPQAGLLLSKDGYFYGTTVGYNVNDDIVRAGPTPAATVNPGTGTFFRFSSASDFVVLSSATDAAGDNVTSESYANLIEGADGFLYGTSTDAGPQHNGLIYQLAVTPVVHDLSLAGAQGTALSIQVPVFYNPTSITASALPAGLILDPVTGIISGTPTMGGTTTGTITVANTLGQTTAALTFTITLAAPAITSGPLQNGQVGTPYTYQITATNGPTSFAASNLPPGLTVNTATGLISGTPTVAGNFNQITISAINAGGTTSVSGTIVIIPLAPVITSPTTADTQAGVPFTYQIAASNSPTSFNATGLPAGLTVNTATGVISGTPTSATVYVISLSATNTTGTGSATLTLTVAPATTTLPAPVINRSTAAGAPSGPRFTYQITASNDATGFTATGLPSGLTLNPATGIITGTLTVAGTFTVALTTTNSGGTGTATLTLTITAVTNPSPVVTSAATASAQQGTAFTYQITATNSPTSFGATGLPTGLTIDPATGLISGTPTESGTFAVNLSATNATGTSTAVLTLTVTEITPVVTVAVAGDGLAVEGGENGKVAVLRTVDLSAALTVNYKVKGDIVIGEDIKAGSVTGTVVIPAGVAQAKIKIKPIDDMKVEGTRVVKIKLKPATDGSYVLGSVTTAKGTLIDND